MNKAAEATASGAGCIRFARILLAALVCSFSSLIPAGCSEMKREALGTLEWDRINGRAVVSEPIVMISAQEGEMVEAGQKLLQLDSRLQEALVAKLQARVQEAQWHVQQLQAGYRPEEIASAAATAEGSRHNRETMQTEYDRKLGLADRSAVSERSVDESANALAQAKATERSANEKLKMLKSGYRTEEIEQVKAELVAAEAELQHAEAQLSRYTIRAERAGLLDSLPFKLGDKPPVGAVVSTVLAGEAPWARIYLPEPWLSQVKHGDRVDILVDGREDPIPGTIRHMESAASFTPYYTLSEDDRSRLSFVTVVDLDPRAAKNLPVGIPTRMRLRNE